MAMLEPWLREQDHDLAVLRQLISAEPAHLNAVYQEVERLRGDIESLKARLHDTD
jgi:ubiquinone biosynthesis protein UbiJ